MDVKFKLYKAERINDFLMNFFLLFSLDENNAMR